MSVSISRARSFDVRNHIRRAAILHLLLDIIGMVSCPFLFLIPSGEDFRLWIIKFGFGIFLPLLALWDLIRSIRHLRDPYTHPALQWKEHGAPGVLIAELEREVAAVDQNFTIGKFVLTPRWFVRTTPFVLSAIPYSQMAWVYKKVTVRRVYYGLIPVGKDYALAVNTRDGKNHLFTGVREAQVDALVAQIVPRAPWAIVGFDANAQQAWDKRRGEFLQTVDARAAWVRQRQAGHESGAVTDFDLGIAAPPMAPMNPW